MTMGAERHCQYLTEKVNEVALLALCDDPSEPISQKGFHRLCNGEHCGGFVDVSAKIQPSAEVRPERTTVLLEVDGLGRCEYYQSAVESGEIKETPNQVPE